MVQLRRVLVSRALAYKPADAFSQFALTAYNPVSDVNTPTFFIGLYIDLEIGLLKSHRGLALVMLCGADARTPLWEPEWLQSLHPRVRVLTSPSLKKFVERCCISPDIIRNVYLGDTTQFIPTPRGRRVYCYAPYERRTEYSVDVLQQVASEHTDIEFYLARWGDNPLPFKNAVATPSWVKRDQIIKIYDDCFCMIRPLERDGFSLGMAEMSLKGRPVMHKLDYTLSWIKRGDSVADFVDFVGRQKNKVDADLVVANSAREYLQDYTFLDT